MRAERLLRLVLLLRTYGQLTARELADRLEVSTRTIQRDLDSLSVSGIPVYSARGRGGGWMLADDYKVNLGGLTPAEATGVFVGRNLQMLADLGLKDAADTAVLKLLTALPAHSRKDAEHARQRVYVDHTDWQGVDPEHAVFLDVLHHGLWNEYKIRLTYGARTTELEVAPLGLVAKHRTWYLVALRDDEAIRTYKVTRITRAEPTETSFDRPADFDLPTYWQQSWRRYLKERRVYQVRLLARPAAVHRLRWAPNSELTLVHERLGERARALPGTIRTTGSASEESNATIGQEPVDDWSEVSMLFENAFEAEMFLLGMGTDAIVLEPSELRARIRETATGTANQHTD